MSTDRQEDSPQRQREQIQPHCRHKGYEVVGEYLDPGITGDEFVKRPQFQRLLRDAQAGKFAGIVVDHKDRMSRQYPIDYIADVVRPLYHAGVWVEAVASGRADWETMGGLLTDHVQQHQAAAESPNIAYRSFSALIRKAREGTGCGGPPPYAYVMTYETVTGKDGKPRQAPRKYDLGDPVKVEIVRWLYREYGSGRKTLEQLRDELHRRGIPGPRGTEWWDRTTIARILANRRYLGDFVYNQQHVGKWAIKDGESVRQSKGGKKFERCKIDEQHWIVIPDHHPAIIDRETFARVQARLRQNRERKTPLVGGGDFLLTQMLVCGRCGLFMWGFHERGERKYRCSGNMRFGAKYCGCNTARETVVLQTVVNRLQAKLLDPDNLARLRAETRAKVHKKQSRDNVDPIKARLKTLQKQIDQGNRNLAILPEDRLAAVIVKVRELEDERDRAQEELERITSGQDAKDLANLIANAEKRLANLQKAFQEGEPALARVMLQEFVDRVVLEFKPWGWGRRSPLVGGKIYLQTVSPLRVPPDFRFGLSSWTSGQNQTSIRCQRPPAKRYKKNPPRTHRSANIASHAPYKPSPNSSRVSK
jgi:site-specific DNA recombinase